MYQFNSTATGLRERIEQEDQEKRNAELRSISQALSLDYCLGLHQPSLEVQRRLASLAYQQPPQPPQQTHQQHQQQQQQNTQSHQNHHIAYQQHNLGSSTAGGPQSDPSDNHTPNSAINNVMATPSALHPSYGIFSLSEQQREALINEQRLNTDEHRFSTNLNPGQMVRHVVHQQQQQQQLQQQHPHQQQHPQQQQQHHQRPNTVIQQQQQQQGRTSDLLPPGSNATAKQLGQVFTPTSGYQQRISQSTTMPSESLHATLASIPAAVLQTMPDMPLDSLLGYNQFNSSAGLRERLELEELEKRNAELRSLTQALSLDYCLGLQQPPLDVQRRFANQLGFQHNLGSSTGGSQSDPSDNSPNSSNSSAMAVPSALQPSYGIFSLSDQQREAILNEQRINTTDQFSTNLNSRPMVRQVNQQNSHAVTNAVANAVNQHVRTELLQAGPNKSTNLGHMTSLVEATLGSATSLTMPPIPQQLHSQLANSSSRLPQQQQHTSILTPPATQSPFRHTNTPSKPESYSAIVAKSTKMLNSSRSPPNQHNCASVAVAAINCVNETNNTASISSSLSSAIAHQHQTTTNNSSSNYNNHHYSTTPSANNHLINSNNDVGTISYTTTNNNNSSVITSATNNSGFVEGKRKDMPPHGSATNLLGFMGLYVGNLSPDLTKEQLEKIFSKYGEPVKAHRLLRSPVAFIKYENTESPRAAIEDLYGVLLPDMTLNTDQPLKLHFDRNDSQLKTNYRPVELPPKKDNGECYNWRTTICRKGKTCPKKHIPINKGIDFQMWMIKPTTSTS